MSKIIFVRNDKNNSAWVKHRNANGLSKMTVEFNHKHQPYVNIGSPIYTSVDLSDLETLKEQFDDKIIEWLEDKHPEYFI